ncbi:DUF6143 family protein [Halobacillus salinarum]|uniref:DUF6143 family protein n=1 Tax=Halobacillus salinarum TaxID=2932257 RepID=A0ABY4ELQ5_9BACI|nr:DUF6143 family protein [Halobacillus salinarum]UOQ44930.1 DUF6143 family protein [Halobacillus salinarum]
MDIKPTVDVINPAFQSTKGRLFAGTSGVLKTSATKNAWAQLVNPLHSNVNLYVSFFALSNFSTKLVKAEFVVNAEPPGKAIVSPDVSVLKLASKHKPVGQILFNPHVSGSYSGGRLIGTRALGPQRSELGFRVDGRLIIEPGTNAMFFISSSTSAEAQIEFEWFENNAIF